MNSEQFGSTPLGIALFLLILTLAGAVALGVYMLPTVIGFAKNSPLKWVWLWINLFLGWTMVIWVLLMLFVVFIAGDPRPVKPQKTRRVTPASAGSAISVSRSTESAATSRATYKPAAGSGINPDHRLPDSSRNAES